MKLYLSSFGLGNHPEELVALTGSGKRAAIILNALDNRQEVRSRFLSMQTEALKNLGYIVEELDLREYFNNPEALKHFLSRKDLLWLNSSNAFILRRAMKQSDFDTIITKLVKNDSIVYGGYSAATVIAAPDLHGVEIIDNSTDIPPGYDEEIPWQGLGFVDFSIVVHYQSDHPEAPLSEKEVQYFRMNHISYRTLKDGQVLIKHGENIRIID